MRRALSAVAVVIGLASAGSAGQQPATQPAPTFRSSTRLIVQTVSVTDRQGRPIEGLTAGDFVVVEEDERQEIAFVEYQDLPDAAAAAAGGSADSALMAAPPATAPAALPPPVDAGIASGAPGDLRYRDKRLLILYFDLTAMPLPDQMRAYTAALTFVGTQMTDADLVAIMAFEGGAVRVKLDFSGDRARLRETLLRLVFGDDLDGDGIPDTPDPGTAFGQDDAEFNIFNTDRQLAALQTAVSMLRPLPERKSLIYFGSGLRLNGSDNQAQLRATTNAAIRANVSLFPIDARGLVAAAPLGDATRPSPGGVGMFSGRLAEASATRLQRSQDTLYSLARDTGGRAMFDDNDLALGIVEAARSMTSYYVLGYYSTHAAEDGRFRRVRVSLADGREAELTYRPGYYADKTFARFSAADRERQLEEALMLENPITEITMAMEVNYFQLNRAEYFVPVAVKMPGSELAPARRRGARRAMLDVIGEVKTAYGVTIQNVRDRIDIELDRDTAGQLAGRPLQYETGFTLLPDDYLIKLLVRDAETGRIGTYQMAFTVPNLDRESQRVPISSVVLSGQQVAVGEELFSVKSAAAAVAVNPLVHDGQKIVPSVTRVFSTGQELHVFLQAYPPAAAARGPLLAYVTFLREDAKVFETEPLAVDDGEVSGRRTLQIRVRIPLNDVPPGRYECQVTVLDPAGGRAAFWRAAIAVVG